MPCVVFHDASTTRRCAGFLLPTAVVLNDTAANLTQAHELLVHLYGAGNVMTVGLA